MTSIGKPCYKVGTDAVKKIKMIQSEEMFFEEYRDKDIDDLSCLSCCLESIEHMKDVYINDKLIDIKKLVSNAIDLLFKYSSEKNEDSKHEFGFEYSETMANLCDQIEEINNLGISFYIH